SRRRPPSLPFAQAPPREQRSKWSCRRRLCLTSQPQLWPFLFSQNQLIEWCNLHDVPCEPDLRRPVVQSGVDLFRSEVVSVDGQKLGLDFLAVDPCAQIAVDAGHRAAAQRSIDVDRAAGDNLGAGTDRSDDG